MRVENVSLVTSASMLEGYYLIYLLSRLGENLCSGRSHAAVL